MTQNNEVLSLTEQLKEWDEVMIALMGEKWNQLTAWQKMCEVASLKEYRRHTPSLLGF